MSTLKKHPFRLAMCAIGFSLAGAMLGVSSTPSVAQSQEETKWTCESLYNCGAGTYKCCTNGDPDAGTYCSRACPIKVE